MIVPGLGRLFFAECSCLFDELAATQDIRPPDMASI
jgi:hypothetical protein